MCIKPSNFYQPIRAIQLYLLCHFQNHLAKHALVFSENRKVLITLRTVEFLKNQIFSDVRDS